MKTQEELQHEADRQERSDEITFLLEWPDDVTRHSVDGGEGISDFHRSLEHRDEGANTREGQATNLDEWRLTTWPDGRNLEKHYINGQYVGEWREPSGSLSTEDEYAQRNAREEQREKEQTEWYANERSRAATADADEEF